MYFTNTLMTTAVLSLFQLGTATPTPGTNAADMTAAPELNPRATSGRFSWFYPGLGACGKWNGEGDLVVALNAPQFDPSTPNGNPNNNPLCGRRIRARYGGRSVDVTVVDKCPSCPWGALDLSPAAFRALADPNVGIVQGSWDWI